VKFIRPFVQAAIIAMAAMAIAGTSTAMASNTALCTHHEEPCAAGRIYEGHFEALAENLTFLTNAINVVCKKGRILGFALGLASPQVTHLEALAYTECLAQGAVACTVESTEIGLLLILRTALNLGSAKMDNTRVSVSCPGVPIECEYEMSMVMHASGSPSANALAEITAAGLPLEGVGMFCPAGPSFDAEYKVVEPDPIFITA